MALQVQKKLEIVMRQCSDENFTVNKQNFEDFIAKFHQKLVECGEQNVYKCDDTGLFYKLAP